MFDFQYHVYSDKERACVAEVYRKDDAKTIAKALTKSTGVQHSVIKIKKEK